MQAPAHWNEGIKGEPGLPGGGYREKSQPTSLPPMFTPTKAKENKPKLSVDDQVTRQRILLDENLKSWSTLNVKEELPDAHDIPLYTEGLGITFSGLKTRIMEFRKPVRETRDRKAKAALQQKGFFSKHAVVKRATKPQKKRAQKKKARRTTKRRATKRRAKKSRGFNRAKARVVQQMDPHDFSAVKVGDRLYASDRIEYATEIIDEETWGVVSRVEECRTTDEAFNPLDYDPLSRDPRNFQTKLWVMFDNATQEVLIESNSLASPVILEKGGSALASRERYQLMAERFKREVDEEKAAMAKKSKKRGRRRS